MKTHRFKKKIHIDLKKKNENVLSKTYKVFVQNDVLEQSKLFETFPYYTDSQDKHFLSEVNFNPN